MPEITAVMTALPESTECHCAACDQHPDPKYPEFGGMVDDEDFGHWWCEWCLSCGCHDGEGNGLPNCSMERFGFPDPLPGGLAFGCCEFCGVEASQITVDDGCWMTADGTIHYTSAPVVWLPNCTCQKDLRDRINGQVAE